MNKGPRVALTVRLPFDEYRECAIRAKARNWSMSDYIGYCVTRELTPGKRKAKAAGAPPANVTLREFSDA
jgi:hypothetical protein